MRKIVMIGLIFLLLGSLTAADFDFEKIKGQVSEFTLKNGLKFVLLEDHSVPIASFVTFTNIGGSDEKIGIYGISHFLEHLAFKGTTEISTKNYKAEKKVMDKMDRVFEQLLQEQNKIDADKSVVDTLKKELAQLQEEAATHVQSNEIDSFLKRNGAVGLNAGTSKDFTMYMVSLPSNKLELWAYLESARFTDPVFREFYKERDVIQEERRVRVENQPVGKLIEEVQAIAYKDHPYKVSVIGPMSNIANITRKDVRRYFTENYHSGNMVIGVAGDVYPHQLKKFAKKYFSKMRAGEKNPLLHTVEPKQPGEKTITMYDDSQPLLLVAYHAPSVRHEDYLKFQILNYLLTNGRSSRIYKRLVVQEKSTLEFLGFMGFPGDKYPCLYLMIAVPNAGKTTAEIEASIFDEIEKVRAGEITTEELESAKIRVKVDTLKGMKSRMGMLMALLKTEMFQGDWKIVFEEFNMVEKITVKDIQDLADKYFTKDNRVIGRMEKRKDDKKEKQQEVAK